MDLVDEQHIAGFEFRQDRRQVSGPLDGRARGDVEVGPQLVCHDAGQGGLAQAGRAGEQQVIGRLLAAAGSLEDDAEPFLQLGLTHELLQVLRPEPALVEPGSLLIGPRETPTQRGLELLVGCRARIEQLVAGHRYPFARLSRAILSSCPGSTPSASRSARPATARRISSLE